MPQFKIDWTTGLIESIQPEDDGREWTLVVCADWAPVRAYKQPLLDNPIALYGDLLPVVQGADISVVNIECVLTDRPHMPIPKDGPNLKAPASAVSALSVVPFHLACLANNHTLDYGPEALADMFQVLHQAGIQTVGAGLNATEAESPVFFNPVGCRLAIVNAAEGEECRSVNGGPGVASLNQDRLVQQISELKREADIVVAILHAGREYVPIPPPYVYQTYRAIVDAGADLVIGHHPHVPQGIEIYHRGLICYSLGNFAFWSNGSHDYRRKGFVVKAYFAGSSLKRARLVPYCLLPDQMVLLTNNDKTSFLKDIQEVSVVLNNPAKVEEAWNAYADDWFRRYGLFQVSCLVNNPASEFALFKTAFRRLWKRLYASWHGSSNGWRLEKLVMRLPTCLSWPTKAQFEETEISALADPMAQAMARLRNKFDTPAHRELYLTALGRAMTGVTGDWPGWAKDLFRKWGAIN